MNDKYRIDYKFTVGFTVCCIDIISKNIFSIIHCSYYSSELYQNHVFFFLKRNGICYFRGMSISGLIICSLLLEFLLLFLWFVYALVWMTAKANMSDAYNEDIAVGVLVTGSFQHSFQ